MTWSGLTTNLTSSNCNNYVYLGTICRTILTKWHLCTSGDSDVIHTNQTKNTQSQKENDLIQLNTLLGNKIYHLSFDLLIYCLVDYKECQQVAIPFLCQYYFPLYDCPNGDIYTASREDCINISTGVCALQWNLAINSGYGDRLPDCHELPSCKYILS